MLLDLTIKGSIGLSFKLTPTELSLGNTSLTVKPEVKYELKALFKEITGISTVQVKAQPVTGDSHMQFVSSWRRTLQHRLN